MSASGEVRAAAQQWVGAEHFEGEKDEVEDNQEEKEKIKQTKKQNTRVLSTELPNKDTCAEIYSERICSIC